MWFKVALSSCEVTLARNRLISQACRVLPYDPTLHILRGSSRFQPGLFSGNPGPEPPKCITGFLCEPLSRVAMIVCSNGPFWACLVSLQEAVVNQERVFLRGPNAKTKKHETLKRRALVHWCGNRPENYLVSLGFFYFIPELSYQ